jgi:chromosome segregation ATPase
MSRKPAVTREKVFAIANDLFAAGIKNPGAAAIRAELEKQAGAGAVGSLTTIQRYLNEWRESRVEEDAAARVPADVLRALTLAFSENALSARSDMAARFEQAEEEAGALVLENEALQADQEELTRELSVRTTERDTAQGQLTERAAEIESLKAALALSDTRSAALEAPLHMARVQTQEANGRIEEIRASTSNQLEAMRAERDAARASQADAERRAIEAEKVAVDAVARLDGERNGKAALQAHADELRGAVQRLEPEARRSASATAEVEALKDMIRQQREHIETLLGFARSAARVDGVAAAR